MIDNYEMINRYARIARAAALAVVCAACGGSSGQDDEASSQGGMVLKRAFPKLTFDAPIVMVQPPGDSSHWYVVDRLGTIKRFDATDEITDTATPVLMCRSTPAAKADC